MLAEGTTQTLFVMKLQRTTTATEGEVSRSDLEAGAICTQTGTEMTTQNIVDWQAQSILHLVEGLSHAMTMEQALPTPGLARRYDPRLEQLEGTNVSNAQLHGT